MDKAANSFFGGCMTSSRSSGFFSVQAVEQVARSYAFWCYPSVRAFTSGTGHTAAAFGDDVR